MSDSDQLFTLISSKIEKKLLDMVDEHMKPFDDTGHGTDHCITVSNHAKTAVAELNLPLQVKFAIIVAALLHDVDDHKLFSTTDNFHAKRILKACNEQEFLLIDLIIEMIDLVSCSSNGNSIVEPRWKLIPRDADRIEALGVIGIVRCYDYTILKKRPITIADTPLPTTEEEINSLATQERMQAYIERKESLSMIDHYYDKLLHIDQLGSENPYLSGIAKSRRQIMVDFLIEFGKTGTFDIENYRQILRNIKEAQIFFQGRK